MDTEPRLLSASAIVGEEVKNPKGEDLGKIEDIKIDIDTGKIAYAVLSLSGTLGIGSKTFAIPWKALRLRAEEKMFVSDIDKETLKKGPAFDKDKWPLITDRRWMSEVFTYYGYKPYWEE